MDLKQLEYIVQIAKENNITHAADKLFITQSALNQQLLRLEKELGTPLFYRSRTDWRPTAAGEVYLKNAHEILRIKKETYKLINDISENKKGTISVGLTQERGIKMFTSIYPDFHEEYPDITVVPREANVKKQQELIARGELDIGILTICDSDRPNLRYISICSEDILLAVPMIHNYAQYASKPMSVLDLKFFKNDSFILMHKESTLRPVIDDLFASAGITPKILFETASNFAIITMIKSGMCCGILPFYHLKNYFDEIACFHLYNYPSWNVVACYRAGNYLSRAEKYFIELATDYWRKEIPKAATKVI
ncbi:MAG: LysR family transcriptional regulator [Sporomusaceae bacterium]|nr:LysR family transcriptional regulator [Sporomusaceae bacterium]